MTDRELQHASRAPDEGVAISPPSGATKAGALSDPVTINIQERESLHDF